MSIAPNRGGNVFSDIMLSGNLAQPRPWMARQTEGQAHEKDEKESVPAFKAKVALAAIRGARRLAELPEQCDFSPTKYPSGNGIIRIRARCIWR
ncbi:MAG: hypothetical protein HY226_04195 [Candidatus Vogelbacteria bacterium]|nr:hypothetical protein [Candidatus Vogelbacteria bacterium]